MMWEWSRRPGRNSQKVLEVNRRPGLSRGKVWEQIRPDGFRRSSRKVSEPAVSLILDMYEIYAVY